MSTPKIEQLRNKLEQSLNRLIQALGPIQIGSKEQFPFGWRKAAKGRTVWRIIEEAVTQNLENNPYEYGFSSFLSADSEVDVYDFTGFLIDEDKERLYVNIKAAVIGAKTNKDDISKAERIKRFFEEDISRKLFIATFIIDFMDNMSVVIIEAKVMPITWLPDIYINPSNNGNLQSSKYRDITLAIRRTNEEFFEEFMQEVERSKERKNRKN